MKPSRTKGSCTWLRRQLVGDSIVPRKTVLEVLRANGVGVSMEGGKATLAKDDRLETIVLPQEVGMRLLQYLKRHYGVPIHQFYNPEMIPGRKQFLQ
jgi:hypothetical protein